VPIAMTTAALGGQVEVPTIDGGKWKVKIPEGTESGKQFRIKSKGMPVLRSKQQGDLYIQVEVETPKSLTRKQRELLKEFENASNESTSPASTGFFARVKEFFEGQYRARVYPHISAQFRSFFRAYRRISRGKSRRVRRLAREG